MLALGHLGFGTVMGRPFTDRRQMKWLLAGTLLPDLIDKPLAVLLDPRFQGHNILTTGARDIGHSMGFFLFLLLVTLGSRSRGLFALTVGVATHLGIDAMEGFIFSGFDQFAMAYGTSNFSGPFSGPYSGSGDGLHGSAEYICEMFGFLLIVLQMYVNAISRVARRRYIPRGRQASSVSRAPIAATNSSLPHVALDSSLEVRTF